MTTIIPTTTLRHLPHLTTKLRPFPRHHHSSLTTTILSSLENADTNKAAVLVKGGGRKPTRLFPKRGEEVELVCENLAFKGKGLCKVEETGYVVMCDRALPGERFVGRVTRKKNNYSEVV